MRAGVAVVAVASGAVATLITVLVTTAASTTNYTQLGILVSVVAFALGVVIVWARVGHLSLLSPYGVFAICHSVIFLLRPIYVLVYGDSLNIFTQLPNGGSFLGAMAIAGAGFLSASLGYAFAAKPVQAATSLRAIPIEERIWKPLRVVLWAIVVAGLALYSAYIVQTGVGVYFSDLFAGRTEERAAALASTSGYFYSGLQFTLGALLVLLFQALATGSRRNAIVVSAVYLVVLLPHFTAGDRSIFIPIVVAVLAYMNYTGAPVLRPSRAVVWGPMLFLLGIIAPRVWRVDLSEGQTLTQSLQSAVSPQNFFDGFVGGLDTAMPDAFSIQVQAQATGQLHELHGLSYLWGLATIIPRSFWPSKPVTVDTYLNSILFPITNAKRIGFSLGIYSEPYLNFGVVGVVIMLAAFGAVMALISNRATGEASIVALFFVVTFTGYLFPLVRGSLSYDSQRLLITDLPVVLALVAVRHFAPARGRAPTASASELIR